MKRSQFNQDVYRRSYKASEFVRRHRTLIVSGAFVFWAALLAVMGYFHEFGQTDTWFLIFGFLWMTVPMSFATYFMLRLVLRAIPLMNGYKPQDDG
jgi:hypothetical protein